MWGGLLQDTVSPMGDIVHFVFYFAVLLFCPRNNGTNKQYLKTIAFLEEKKPHAIR
jgi:hypothetical protein